MTRLPVLALFCIFSVRLTAAEPERKIELGDNIVVTFFNNPDLDLQAAVPPSGEVIFKLVGKVKVVGMLPSELEKKLTELYKPYVRDPIVSVLILKFGTEMRQVYVLEGVKKPGAFPLPETEEMTLLQAISLAEGLLPEANRQQVRILRKDAQSGQRKVVVVSLDEITRPDSPSPDFPLVANDVVVVPRVAYVHILGAVQNAGSYVLPMGADTVLTQVLALAGSYSHDADLQNVEIIRGSQRQKVNLAAFFWNRSKENNPVVLPGDTVFVPVASLIHVFGAVAKPGAYPYPVGQTLTLAEAISMAEGLAREADVTNIRLSRPGSPDRQVTTFDLTKLILGTEDPKKDIAILPGDLIIVPRLQPIYVHGRVKAAGVYYPSPGEKLTVSRAVAMAGGFDTSPLTKAIQLRRMAPDGKFKTTEVDLRSLYRSGDTSHDVEVLPGDEVFVPENIWGGGP